MALPVSSSIPCGGTWNIVQAVPWTPFRAKVNLLEHFPNAMEVILVYLSCFKFYLDLLVCVFDGRRRRRGRREERGREGACHQCLSWKYTAWSQLHTSCESTLLESELLHSSLELASSCKALFFLGGSFAAILISNFLSSTWGAPRVIGYRTWAGGLVTFCWFRPCCLPSAASTRSHHAARVTPRYPLASSRRSHTMDGSWQHLSRDRDRFCQGVWRWRLMV